MNYLNRTILNSLLTMSFILAMAIAFMGCSDSDSPSVDKGSVKLVENSTLGSMLVDSKGISLYFYTKDVNGVSSTCTAGCLASWPIFYAENVSAGEGLNQSDFENITRSDGQKQTLYKGWPLYYFVQDERPNETTGEGVGDVWFVAKPNYSLMLADAQLVGQDGKNYNSSFKEGIAETQYFVDSLGRTIYLFTKDAKNQNKFTKSDFSNNSVWPIFYSNLDALTLPSTIKKEDFGKITVFGHSQLTYKGWPLYYFGQDKNRGDNKGISFPTPGIWPIVNTETNVAP